MPSTVHLDAQSYEYAGVHPLMPSRVLLPYLSHDGTRRQPLYGLGARPLSFVETLDFLRLPCSRSQLLRVLAVDAHQVQPHARMCDRIQDI